MARPPALDCSVGGGDEDTGPEVLETEDQDLPGAALNTAAATGAEESSVQEPRSSRGEESRGGPRIGSAGARGFFFNN